MSRRTRAVAFGAVALVCAVLAATLAGGYRSDLEQQLGELRPVVVAAGALPAREPIRPADADRLLEERRVPERFVPPDALTDPREAVGRAALAPIPVGSYVVASQFRAPGGPGGADALGQAPAPGRPVEISVTGAGALTRTGRSGAIGHRVDVIVTTEPGPGGGSGHTYVAAEAVTLLALDQGGELPGDEGVPDVAGGPWTATLSLTRDQALRLIEAESFARDVRLIGSGGGDS